MNSPVPFKPLSKTDVADILGVTVRTIENHIVANILPAPAAIGNRRYWHPDVFYAWLEQALRNGGVNPSDAASPRAAAPTQASFAEAPAPCGVLPEPASSRGQAKGSAVERARVRDRARLRKLAGM